MSLKIIYDNSIEVNIGEQYTPAIINEETEMLVDKIASFLEQEENWKRLKNAWLVSGRSEDLRSMLRKALEDNF